MPNEMRKRCAIVWSPKRLCSILGSRHWHIRPLFDLAQGNWVALYRALRPLFGLQPALILVNDGALVLTSGAFYLWPEGPKRFA